MTFQVRPATPEDLQELALMCAKLWPHATAEEHARDLEPILAGRAPGTLPAIVFLAADGGRPIGFVQVGLRSHADGCDPSQAVGFIEGWYVHPEWRRQRVGAQLILAAESWAKGLGCAELASDTWVDHLDSQRAHTALGFEVVDRCVHYRKRL